MFNPSNTSVTFLILIFSIMHFISLNLKVSWPFKICSDCMLLDCVCCSIMAPATYKLDLQYLWFVCIHGSAAPSALRALDVTSGIFQALWFTYCLLTSGHDLVSRPHSPICKTALFWLGWNLSILNYTHPHYYDYLLKRHCCLRVMNDCLDLHSEKLCRALMAL